MSGIAAVIPLYNKADYVIESIESILRQTRVPDEIVIVDDGSTDGSRELVQERYGDDPRVQIILQKNLGPGAARNAGITATKSPLIAFMDADDKWLPEKLEKQGAFMEENESCMLSFSASIQLNEKTGEVTYKPLDIMDGIDKETFVRKHFFQERFYVGTTSAVMVRRDALDEVGMFDESLWKAQDTDLWLRIMLRFDFDYFPQHLTWCRRGFPRSNETIERGFHGNDFYFQKNRHTFGKDIKGHLIWRAGYASVLRGHANWYFRQCMGKKALKRLLKAIWLWPFFNPVWVIKSAAEYLIGSNNYDSLVGWGRKLIGRPRAEVSETPSQKD